MNLVSITTVLLSIVGIYLALGFLFALYFAFRGANKIDPGAASGSWGFRLLIIPGTCLFWPLLLSYLMRGFQEPPDEKNNHRSIAGDPS